MSLDLHTVLVGLAIVAIPALALGFAIVRIDRNAKRPTVAQAQAQRKRWLDEAFRSEADGGA